MKDLEGWILQMDDYFTITQTRNEVQRLANVGLCTEGDALDCWKSNKHRFNACRAVTTAIKEYYGDHYKPDRAFNEMSDLKQTGTVQKYLNDIDRLNVYAKMTDHHLINIILNGITSCLRQAMVHYEDLGSDLSKWKEKLLHMDFITKEFQKKEQDNRSKGQGKKCSLDERIQLRGRETGTEKKKGEFGPQDVRDKRKEEGRCMKCGRSNHQARDCKALSGAKTLPSFGNAVKAQVRDLRYNSGNISSNRIIRHMLTKWIDHPPGICGWGVRMALKGLDIRKCVSSGLASCMFNIRCISITFCCSLFICYHWIILGSAHVS